MPLWLAITLPVSLFLAQFSASTFVSFHMKYETDRTKAKQTLTSAAVAILQILFGMMSLAWLVYILTRPGPVTKLELLAVLTNFGAVLTLFFTFLLNRRDRIYLGAMKDLVRRLRE